MKPYTKLAFKTIVLLVTFFLAVHSLGFTPQIFAQEDLWYIPTPIEHQIALDECSTGNVGLECTVQAIVVEIMNSMSFAGGGDPTQNDQTSSRGGAIIFAGRGISTLISTPPVFFSDYTQYLAQRLNLAQPAYAQGTGYDALSPFMPLWTAFRNIAYLAFVLIFIVIGFMIMFRAKIDPQTVVNIQNALPNLVITLILITFSYAIAGFMVDLIYLGIFLMVSVIADQGLIGNAVAARNDLIEENLFSLVFGGSYVRANNTLGAALSDIITTALQSLQAAEWIESIAGSISSSLGQIVITFALLISIFRLFFQVIIAYVQIVLATIFAPIMILFNAFPGSGSFSGWLKNLLANVLIFPAIAALFLISAVIMGPCVEDGCPFGDWDVTQELIPEGEVGWLPPFTAFTTDPGAVKNIIAYGLILFAPQIAGMLKQALKSKALPASGVFGAVASGAGAAGALGSAALSPGRGVVNVARTYGTSFISQLGERAAGEGRHNP